MTDHSSWKQAIEQHQQQFEQLYQDTSAQLKEVVADAQDSIETETKKLNQSLRTEISLFKNDLLQRASVIKAQFQDSQKSLNDYGDLIKTEATTLVDSLAKVTTDVKEDLSQVVIKHTHSVSDVLNQSKLHIKQAWQKFKDD